MAFQSKAAACNHPYLSAPRYGLHPYPQGLKTSEAPFRISGQHLLRIDEPHESDGKTLIAVWTAPLRMSITGALKALLPVIPPPCESAGPLYHLSPLATGVGERKA
jgi:hypothetical protein